MILIVPISGWAQAIIFIEPFPLTSPQIGQQFVIEVQVENVQSLAGFEFEIGYNITAVQFVSATENAFLKDASGDTFTLNPLDNGNGKIFYAMAGIGGRGTDGAGILAVLGFEVVDLKDSTLEFVTLTLSDTAGNDIPVAEQRCTTILGIRSLIVISPTPDQVFEVGENQPLTIREVCGNSANGHCEVSGGVMSLNYIGTKGYQQRRTTNEYQIDNPNHTLCCSPDR